MATEIIRPGGTEGHDCVKELPGVETYSVYPRLVDKKKQPQGLIVRCSCGKLWVLKHYHINYNEWKEAGWRLRYKHRNNGWEGVRNESY